MLYPPSPLKINVINSANNQINIYADKCIFDEFLSIFKTDYVGIVDKDAMDNLVHEI